MAIDSREKRASVVGIHYLSGPSPTPNAAQDVEWRQEVGYGYPGIAPDSPVAVVTRQQIKLVGHGILMSRNPLGARSTP